MSLYSADKERAMLFSGLMPKFRRDNGGAALIEMMFVLPFVVLLMFGAIELARYVLITQRVERAGYAVGDMLTQLTPPQLTADSLDKIGQQLPTMLQPYEGNDRQVVIFSSLSKRPFDNLIIVNWQYATGGNFTSGETISIVNGRNANAINGFPGEINGLPANLSGDVADQLRPGFSTGMAPNENLIVAEVFYGYRPAFGEILTAVGFGQFAEQPATLARRMFFHPRNGDLLGPLGSGTWGPAYPVIKSGCTHDPENIIINPDCASGGACSPRGSTCVWRIGEVTGCFEQDRACQ
jgi:hypothetical protein